ncbi:hypothetical protein [Methylocucumis oryzae]|uniref:Uncharacterized protein n=1 Tax=Methylocucumis oryzae TaxID=1632867 RepID=A0A0F3IKS2_9GAMM|nr:hypothetical protein [Methylocucumis oryzae]KJV07118.1 hypothetical protein VZ94_06905 [Methylocucumis oryzae]
MGICYQTHGILAVVNPAAPDKTFEAFWAELSALNPAFSPYIWTPAVSKPVTRIGKFYGRAFTVSAITESSVTIDSPDIHGIVEVPRESFEVIYADWRQYRYESLANTNSQETLHVISIIEHVVQTWVRREERTKLIELARTAELLDGIFLVVSYNGHGRIIGPSPVGEPVLLKEVFSDHTPAVLSELELAATKLFNTRATSIEKLAAEHPGFDKAAYRSVVARTQWADR